MSFCREGIFVATICWKTTKFVFTLFYSLPVPTSVLLSSFGSPNLNGYLRSQLINILQSIITLYHFPNTLKIKYS